MAKWFKIKSGNYYLAEIRKVNWGIGVNVSWTPNKNFAHAFCADVESKEFEDFKRLAEANNWTYEIINQ